MTLHGGEPHEADATVYYRCRRANVMLFCHRDLLPHATLPPHTDHNYAQWQDRDIALSAVAPETPLKTGSCEISVDTESVGMVLWSIRPNSQFDDMRQCLFCGKYGDDVPTVRRAQSMKVNALCL